MNSHNALRFALRVVILVHQYKLLPAVWRGDLWKQATCASRGPDVIFNTTSLTQEKWSEAPDTLEGCQLTAEGRVVSSGGFPAVRIRLLARLPRAMAVEHHR